MRRYRRPRVLSREKIFSGRIIELVNERIKINGHRVTREIIQHPGAVVIVPMLDRKRVVFVRQYRHAIGQRILELPAGTLGKNESPVACARRELEEETGWRARKMRRVCYFYPAPGYTTEKIVLFVAHSLTRSKAKPDFDEQVEPVVLSLRTAARLIRTGAICDAKSIIGIALAANMLPRG